MRSFLLLGVSLLLSCQASKPTTQAHSEPVVVGNDTVSMVTTVTVGKKSTVVVQSGGYGNSATTTGTDNNGRGASTGANGGNSQPTTYKAPAWALGLVFLISAIGGAWGWQQWQTWRGRMREVKSG